MKCPHCLEAFFEKWIEHPMHTNSPQNSWTILEQNCPSCHKPILMAAHSAWACGAMTRKTQFIYPKTPNRSQLPVSVPKEYADDYNEACLVLSDSPKASAALSRRCLQNLIHNKIGIKARNLNEEIDLVIQQGVPSYLAQALDSIRTLGNFAAHPIKSTNSGEIIDVEPTEAEWTLDTLEGLFDYYFVQPTILQQKRDALNDKLSAAAKPPLK